MNRFLIVVFCILIVSAGTALAQNPAPTPPPQVIEQLHSWIDATTIWKESDGLTTRTTIPVCWENLNADTNGDTARVKEAIATTWQTASRLRFTGWQTCSGLGNNGIRIFIEDSGPHTKGLGSNLNGIKNGMVLNFTFINWSPACRATPEMRIECVKSIAVHEFGHAIGFAHEQNRPDAPGECQEERQGGDGTLFLTPYDPESVMNYCNPKYNNLGNLSKWDKEGVSKVYGFPMNPAQERNARAAKQP